MAYIPNFIVLFQHIVHINRHEQELASERLSVELKKLDRHVSTAVVDHITTVFADAELPVHNMIQAATASLLVFTLSNGSSLNTCSFRVIF